MRWFFGEYIQRLLDRKEWNTAKLAKKASLSHVYVGQLIRGDKPDTGRPPKLSVDTLQAIAEAFNIPETHLLLAYKGIDPEKSDPSGMEEFDLLTEVNLVAAHQGTDLNQLNVHERCWLEGFVIKMMRQIIQVVVEEGIAKIKQQ